MDREGCRTEHERAPTGVEYKHVRVGLDLPTPTDHTRLYPTPKPSTALRWTKRGTNDTNISAPLSPGA